MSNTITAVFKGGKLLHFREGSLNTKTPSLWQWDYGQILEIVGLPLPRTVEMHIARKDDMISRIGLTEDNVTRVALPDEYLTTSDPITVYVYLHTGEEDGETEYRINLPIIPRPKPVDYDIEDHEVSVAYQALIDATGVMSMDIETVTSMKNTTEQYMNMAGEKADSATSSATAATDAATEARSWAVGGTSTRSGEDTNNSKWWSEKAAESAAEVEAYLIRETVTQIDRVISEGNRQVQRVESVGSETINEIETAGEGQIEDIEAAGTGQIEDIEAVGTTQVNAVKAEGAIQAQDISDSKDEVVEAVSAEGTRQIGIIASKETEITNRITSAGNTQVDRVNQMGTTQYYAIGSLSSQQKLEIQNLGNQTKNAVTVIANTAKSYAVGDTGTRTGENTDNAKYYAEKAVENVETALQEAYESGRFKGDPGEKGDKGDPGVAGPKGDKGDPGEGIAQGGTAGQVLKKKSSTDYDTEWADEQEVPVQDVQVDGTSILSNGVANLPRWTSTDYGVSREATEADCKTGSSATKAISTRRQYAATFYGLATAAGDTTQAISSNAVGTYTDGAKAAIQTMLGLTNLVNSSAVSSIWVGTQVEYDQLTPDANTLYLIKEV